MVSLTPVTALTPSTVEPRRAAGRPEISTVGEPTVMAPTQTAPLTKSPMTAAGKPPINTLGMPGPVIGSAVTVRSVSLAAGVPIVVVGLVTINEDASTVALAPWMAKDGKASVGRRGSENSTFGEFTGDHELRKVGAVC